MGSNVVKTELNPGDVGKNVVSYSITRVQGDADAEEAEYWGPFGLQSRPPASSGKPDDAAQVLSINMAGDHLIIGGRDHRTNKLYGNLGDGDTALYGGGQGRILIKNNGSINLYTTQTNVDGGPGMGIFVDPANDTISITNSKGYGIVIKSDGVYINGGGGSLILPVDGNVLLAGTGATTVDGGSIKLGAGALVANTALSGPTGTTAVPSTKVFITVA